MVHVTIYRYEVEGTFVSATFPSTTATGDIPMVQAYTSLPLHHTKEFESGDEERTVEHACSMNAQGTSELLTSTATVATVEALSGLVIQSEDSVGSVEDEFPIEFVLEVHFFISFIRISEHRLGVKIFQNLRRT